MANSSGKSKWYLFYTLARPKECVDRQQLVKWLPYHLEGCIDAPHTCICQEPQLFWSSKNDDTSTASFDVALHEIQWNTASLPLQL